MKFLKETKIQHVWINFVEASSCFGEEFDDFMLELSKSSAGPGSGRAGRPPRASKIWGHQMLGSYYIRLIKNSAGSSFEQKLKLLTMAEKNLDGEEMSYSIKLTTWARLWDQTSFSFIIIFLSGAKWAFLFIYFSC